VSAEYARIHGILDLHTQSLASAQGLAVAWENHRFRPPAGECWLRPSLLPAGPRRVGLGPSAPDLLQGVYQVSLFAPTGNGWGEARTLADAVLAHFQAGATLASAGVRVSLVRAGCSPAPEQEGWFHIPVNVNWQSYTAWR
jgi:hypothetical protein